MVNTECLNLCIERGLGVCCQFYSLLTSMYLACWASCHWSKVPGPFIHICILSTPCWEFSSLSFSSEKLPLSFQVPIHMSPAVWSFTLPFGWISCCPPCSHGTLSASLDCTSHCHNPFTHQSLPKGQFLRVRDHFQLYLSSFPGSFPISPDFHFSKIVPQ